MKRKYAFKFKRSHDSSQQQHSDAKKKIMHHACMLSQGKRKAVP